MTDSTHKQTCSDEDSHRASFILRCWIGPDGQARSRLIDVRSGRDYPLANLADLPERVQRLLAQGLPPDTELDRSLLPDTLAGGGKEDAR